MCRYEKGFAPNVSLAPAVHKKLDAEENSVDEEEFKKILERKKHSSGVSEKSNGGGKEWDLISESDESLHQSDEGNFLNS